MNSFKQDIVSSYFQRIFFINVPNICNNKCYYCYTQPSFATKAHIPDTVMNDLKKIILLLKNVGFEEIRISGGEPLVFDNITDLTDMITFNNLKYSLITNGIVLSDFVDYLCHNRPLKLSISYNSLLYNDKICGFDKNVKKLDEDIIKLLDSSVSLSINIVALKENIDEIIPIIVKLVRLGIANFKVIYPNTPCLSITYDDYIAVLDKINDANIKANIRVTDFSCSSCLLKDRGFLHMSIPDMQISNCCLSYNIIQQQITEQLDDESIMKNLSKIFDESRTGEFKCNTTLYFCPIALKYL